MTNPINPLSNQLARATLARFESQRQDALATIQLYLNASVGVGDHPDIVTELCNATRRLAEAEEALEALERNFLAPENPSSEE
jgi:hypothetical protein|tara:strand:- start:473 stop:721 length:249 start_codon:yes stop_codon:yes gene_type:complete